MPANLKHDADLIPDVRISWPSGYAPESAWVFAQNTIDINAPLDIVWSVLIDCTAWPQWYRHCSDVAIIRGQQSLDADSIFRFRTIGNNFEPQVEVFEPSRMLIWTAKGPAGTRGAHAWLIEPTPSGCRVVTEEAQFGLLLSLMRKRMRSTLLDVHQDWLTGLKEVAEKRSKG